MSIGAALFFDDMSDAEIDDLRHTFERDGRVWLRNALPECSLLDLAEAGSNLPLPGQRLNHSDALSRTVAENAFLRTAIAKIDPLAKPVRVVAFNKSKQANWGVPWHQDRVISVAERHEIAGYQNWTLKSGVWHCEPPERILQRMLFVRVYLDSSDCSNGAMEIAVGSHKRGKVAAKDAEAVAQECPIEVCTSRPGDILILKMLTLHASKPANVPSNRRVLRIDFSPPPLPDPLKWMRASA